MTNHETALRELLTKGTDARLLREMIGFAAECLVAIMGKCALRPAFT